MTDAKHEAPAEGAGEIEGLKRRIKCLEKLAGEQSLRVMQQATRAKDAENELVALRARSSAPEAREGEAVESERIRALANLFNIPDGGRYLNDWIHRAGEYNAWRTHPAAPSADKLRIAVEALEPFNKAFQAYLAVYANFMPPASTEAEQRFAEGERKDTAEAAAFDVLSKVTFEQLCAVNEALAALKAEGGA